MVETGRTRRARASFFGDAQRIWNNAPILVTKKLNLSQLLKRRFENFVQPYQFNNVTNARKNLQAEILSTNTLVCTLLG